VEDTIAEPAVSVVVATRDRAPLLLRLLDALAVQSSAPPFEVVVVDDGSSDTTAEAVRAVAGRLPYPLRFLSLPVSAGSGAARNQGWRAARADRIAFTDDDCVPAPGWVAALSGGLDLHDIAVGRTRPPDDQLHLIGPFSSYLDMDHNGTFSTCNIGYRRPVLEATAGFDHHHFPLPNGEDTDLGLRATKGGFRDGFVAGALVYHDVHRSDFRSHLRRVHRLEGLVTLVARHPEARRTPLDAGLFLRSVDKAVLISWAAALGLVARPRRPGAWALGAVAGGLYVWQFGKSHYSPQSATEWLSALPLGYVADSWAVVVMIRGSWRWRTILL
jgi:glycosyltransferase involved in cell wall biosynthesis